MRIIIFGAGAMSCLFAARLAPIAPVTLIDTWKEAVNTIRERGILYEDLSETRIVRVQAEYLGAPVVPAELVIVLVKSWQTKSIAPYLNRSLTPSGIALSLQNGLGNLEALGSGAFPGSTAEGATLLGPGHVKAGGSGPTHVVADSWVVDTMKRAGFECHSCSPDEAESLLWSKLSASCGINALTALLQIPNGELLNRPASMDLMVRAAVECSGVAEALGIRLAFEDAAAHVKQIAAKTAANRSSMLQDVMRGAPTECDAINGAVVCEGRRVGVATPVNETLWQLVRAAVHSDRSNPQ